MEQHAQLVQQRVEKLQRKHSSRQDLFALQAEIGLQQRQHGIPYGHAAIVDQIGIFSAHSHCQRTLHHAQCSKAHLHHLFGVQLLFFPESENAEYRRRDFRKHLRRACCARVLEQRRGPVGHIDGLHLGSNKADFCDQLEVGCIDGRYCSAGGGRGGNEGAESVAEVFGCG